MRYSTFTSCHSIPTSTHTRRKNYSGKLSCDTEIICQNEEWLSIFSSNNTWERLLFHCGRIVADDGDDGDNYADNDDDKDDDKDDNDDNGSA